MTWRVLHIEDQDDYFDALRAQVKPADEIELVRLRDSVTLHEWERTGRLLEFDAYVLDLSVFDAHGEDDLRRLGGRLATAGKRVVFWSGAAAADTVPAGCAWHKERAKDGPRTIRQWIRGEAPLPSGQWTPPVPVLPLAALDVLCQGWLALAGVQRGVASDVLTGLQSLDFHFPPDGPVPNAPDWFAPTLEPIRQTVAAQGAANFWSALGAEGAAIKELIDRLDSGTPTPAEDWDQLVLAAHAALRGLTARGYL